MNRTAVISRTASPKESHRLEHVEAKRYPARHMQPQFPRSNETSFSKNKKGGGRHKQNKKIASPINFKKKRRGRKRGKAPTLILL